MSQILAQILAYNDPENAIQKLKEWSEQGKKLVGWLCRYAPQELLHAAGLHPVRLFGNIQEEHAIGDAYMSSITCPYCRSCIDVALQGSYQYLTGLVSTNSCCSMNRLYDVWSHYLNTPLMFLLDLPYTSHNTAINAFRSELIRFKKALEEVSGQEITEEKIRSSIQLFNRTRELLERLYNLKKDPRPPITGAETLGVILAGQVLPREEYNHLLELLLQEIPGRFPYPDGIKTRLLVSGSILTDPRYIQSIENQGAAVVTDDLCTGTRYFQFQVSNSGDLMEALSRGYLSSIPCSRMIDRPKRIDHILKLTEGYQVDGVIYSVLKFCQPYQYDLLDLEEKLKAQGIPLLKLEREYSLSGLGQLKTRVQAFLEIIQP
jgi:bzd-type benzoyl-CoA reductase N subunit